MSTILRDQKNKRYGSTLYRSFVNAVTGIARAIAMERSIRIEIAVFLLVVLLGWWIKLSVNQWLSVLLVSAAVFTVELINSSIEHLADALHPEYSEQIRWAKDISAGAVLLVSIVALTLGLNIFMVPLWRLL